MERAQEMLRAWTPGELLEPRGAFPEHSARADNHGDCTLAEATKEASKANAAADGGTVSGVGRWKR